MSNDISKLHNVLKEILAEVDQVCSEHKLNYYMIGGTFLGAVRHQDIIPWDIDVDIALFRNEYDKLIDILKNHKTQEYELKVTTDKGHISPHAVLYLNKTMMEFDTRILGKTLRRRAFIDIFPLDRMPDDAFIRIKQEKKIRTIQKRLYLQQGDTMRKSFFEGVLVYCRKILYAFPTRRNMQIKLDKLMRLGMNSTSDIFCQYASQYSYGKVSYNSFVYGTPVRYKFGDYFFLGPEKADEFLKTCYGDYMQLPSEANQIASKNFLVSFTDYRKPLV